MRLVGRLLGGLCADVSSNWSEPLGDHLPPVDVPGSCLELSIFFASCLTLFVGHLSRSMLLSLIVLETNSSFFRKNEKMSLWCILAVSWGYLAKTAWVCTALYHSSTDLFPCKKLVNKSNLALTLFD